MNPQLKLIKPLVEQLDFLKQVVNESPYISREERIAIEQALKDLASKLKDGEVLYPQVEKQLNFLNKQAATHEITNLTKKIRHLNPKSPRLEYLLSLEKQLRGDEISPEQARRSLQELMKG